VGVGAAILAGNGSGTHGSGGTTGSGLNHAAGSGAGPALVGVGAFVARSPSVDVRRAPAAAAAVTAQLPYHAPVLVVCTAIGDPVRGPYLNSNITTPVWDEVAKPGATAVLGFASDAYIETGTAKLLTRPCRPSPGRGSVRSAVRLRPGVEVRRSAALGAGVTAGLPYQTPVVIVCTAIGDPVAEPPGTPNLTYSPVWDRVRAGRTVGYVPDVFLRTPSYKPVAPLC
jgi:hypothetical protein